jgi:diadenosine tetraphosphate (Ap4A) HIT family hydrolase
MNNIIDYNGEQLLVGCIGCARESDQIIIGNLIKTNYFDAHQDLEIPIPGFVIISSRRHIKSVDEFTEDEQIDFIKLLSNVRKAQRSALKIDEIILIQEENSKHHFHIWLFPRYSWMDKFGKKVSSSAEVIKYAKMHMKTPENLELIKKANNSLIQFLS